MKKMNKKTGSCFILPIILISILTGCSLSARIENNSQLDENSLIKLGNQIGIVWENARATNLGLTVAGNWDSEEVADPKVVKIGSKYYLFYSGKGPDGVWRIGYASSYDGISWARDYVNNPILRPNTNSSEIFGIRVCSVIYDEKTEYFKVWYRGYGNPEPNKTGYSCGIFFARSKSITSGWFKHPNVDTNEDGDNTSSSNIPPQPIIFIAKSGVDLNNNWIGSTCVVEEPYFINNIKYSSYSIWYTANYYGDDFNKPKPIIKSAFSPFESNWLNIESSQIFLEGTYTSAFFNKGFMMPAVIKDYYDGQMIYKMWFFSYNTPSQAGYARSYDAKFFDYYNDPDFTPIFTTKGIKTDPVKDSENILYPFVMRDENKYKMWYVGKDEYETTICYKESLDR